MISLSQASGGWAVGSIWTHIREFFPVLMILLRPQLV